MTFGEFHRRANRIIIAKVGIGIDDFADADWYSLYEDTRGEATEEEIIALLSEADMIFARMIELYGSDYVILKI